MPRELKTRRKRREKRDADSRGTTQPGQTGPSEGSFRQKRQARPVLTINGRTFIFTDAEVPTNVAADFVSTGM